MGQYEANSRKRYRGCSGSPREGLHIGSLALTDQKLAEIMHTLLPSCYLGNDVCIYNDSVICSGIKNNSITNSFSL